MEMKKEQTLMEQSMSEMKGHQKAKSDANKQMWGGITGIGTAATSMYSPKPA